MKNKILIIITFLAGTLMFNSCLKDKLTEDWTASLSGKMYAQIVNAGLQSFTINNGSADQTVRIFTNIATDAVPTSDITVTFAIDPAALAAQNAIGLAAYVAAHSADVGYNINNFKPLILCPNVTIAPLVIKAGTRNGNALITLKSANTLSLTTSYAVPVTITAVTGGVTIASNFKSVVMQVPVANKWEGSYNMNYFALRAGDPVLTGYVKNLPWKLGTAGATTVKYFKTHLWGDGKGTIGGIGAWEITIDETKTANNLTLLDRDNAAVVLNSAYNNRWDAATKTFYIAAYWGAGPTSRAAVDTLRYTGAY